MLIELKLSKDFERCLDELRKKYGEDFEYINGIHPSQLDFSEYIENFVDKNTLADSSIDPNANANHKDIRSFMTEKAKSEDKLFGLNKIFLEIKKKYDGIVYKRRVAMTYRDACFYAFTGKKPSYLGDLETSEFDFFLKRHPITRSTFLTYDREAYAASDGGELRITFDTNIRYQLKDFSFDERQAADRIPMVGRLMEIKNPVSMPLWVAQMLSEYRIKPFSFSKYGTVYKNNIIREETKCSVQLSALV